jgi:phospholipid N-methyltransferase
MTSIRTIKAHREPLFQRAKFLRAFLAGPSKVGAVLPSSRALCRVMVEMADIAHAKNILEFGPGTGVVTDQIVPRLPPGCRYMAIELSPSLAKIVRERHPETLVRNDDVREVERLCREEAFGPIDIVYSGLPWASFSRELQVSILDGMMRVMRPGAEFITFTYQVGLLTPASRRFHAMIRGYFRSVERSRLVWRNLPPAYVIRCVR